MNPANTSLKNDEPQANSTPVADVDIGVDYTGEQPLIFPLLKTLSRSGDDVKMRLFLVDNATRDNVQEMASDFENVSILRNNRRCSYACNMTRVLQASSARYILLCNTDMFFDPPEQCITKMVCFMDKQTDCGIATCRIYHPQGDYAHPARRFPTIGSILARRFPFLSIFPQSLEKHLYLDREHQETFDADWLSGCFLMVRREAFLQAGALDLRFRKYFEDVDYCQTLAQHHWRVMCYGGTYCYHLEQRASKRLISLDAAIHIVSYLKWLLKHRGFFKQQGNTSRPHLPKQQKEVPTPRSVTV